MAIEFQRRDFADDEGLAVETAEWTAARLRAPSPTEPPPLLIVSGRGGGAHWRQFSGAPQGFQGLATRLSVGVETRSH